QLRRSDPPEATEAAGDLVVEDGKGDAGQRQREERVAAGKGDQVGKRHGDDRVVRGVDCTRAALNRPATGRAGRSPATRSWPARRNASARGTGRCGRPGYCG